MIRLILAATCLALSISNAARAQQPPVKPPSPPATQPPQPPARPGEPRAPGDTAGRADSTRNRIRDFRFTAPDSTMRALLDREGYRKVQYEGSRVRFDAQTRILELTGLPAGVNRDGVLLVGDSVFYNDSTKRVVARSDTVFLLDPQQNDGEGILARGQIDYDAGARIGTVGAFSTAVTAGQKLYITARRGTLLADTTIAARHVVYARDGSFTFCDHAEPHFHFDARDIKYVSQNIMVARPVVLYVGEVPVFVLPFFFKDTRANRSSGLLQPSFGIAEIFRNSPSYRRSISNIGYFVAINDYMNAEASFDWRSGARTTDFDPGYLRGNLEYRYRWLNRFITGETAVSYLAQRNGTTNLSLTWNHNQDFSKQTRLTSRINFVQNTQVQRATTVNPNAANATMLSQLNYQTKLGPASVNIGGTRRQYPGRAQVDMDFPSLNVTTGTLGNDVFGWTPSLRLSVSQSQKLDQGVQYPFVYRTTVSGGVDSTRIRADRRNTQIGFDTPIKIGFFQWQNSFTMSDVFNDYPEQRIVVNVRDSSQRVTRLYARTYETNIDWTTSFNLPPLLRGTFNLTPSVSLANIDPSHGLLVRRETSNGQFVSQSKRPSFSLGIAPTVYGFFPGIGPLAKIRHTISPTLSYSYSPEQTVSDRFLQAINATRQGYLGALPQQRVTLGFNTNIEAKLKEKAVERAATDTGSLLPRGGDAGKKLTLLSLNFSPLTYDFERADSTGKGFTDRTFSLSGRTDLLPGFDFRTSFELFQGDPDSDTSTFSPYRTDLGVSFTLNSQSALAAFIGRLLGRRDDVRTPDDNANRLATPNEQNLNRQTRQSRAAGGSMRGTGLSIPTSQGWNLSLQYNASRQRPPRGGLQILNDPATLCESFRTAGIAAYDRCVFEAQNAPPTGDTTRRYVAGAPIFISPPVQNVTSALTFNITQNWAAQWSTQYDVVRARFSSQQIGLQRALHDANAVFSFTQAPNGNFAFSFYLALKAQPELKFNYDRQTYRSSSF